jgi:hypothetical protein
VELMEGKLFVKPVKAEGGWLWHSDRIYNMMVVVLGYCLDEFVERVKGRMGNIVSEGVPTAWFDSLL